MIHDVECRCTDLYYSLDTTSTNTTRSRMASSTNTTSSSSTLLVLIYQFLFFASILHLSRCAQRANNSRSSNTNRFVLLSSSKYRVLRRPRNTVGTPASRLFQRPSRTGRPTWIFSETAPAEDSSTDPTTTSTNAMSTVLLVRGGGGDDDGDTDIDRETFVNESHKKLEEIITGSTSSDDSDEELNSSPHDDEEIVPLTTTTTKATKTTRTRTRTQTNERPALPPTTPETQPATTTILTMEGGISEVGTLLTAVEERISPRLAKLLVLIFRFLETCTRIEIIPTPVVVDDKDADESAAPALRVSSSRNIPIAITTKQKKPKNTKKHKGTNHHKKE